MDSHLILTLLFDPRRASRELPRAQPLLTVVLVLLLVSFSEALASLLVVRSALGESSGILFLLWTAALDLGMILPTLLAAGVFLPFGARMMGGDGRQEDFLWPLFLSYSPWLLWAGLGLLFQLTSVAPVLYLITQLLLTGWIVWIQVVALSEVFRFSVLRASFATFLGYGLAAILFLLFLGVGCFSLANTLVMWIPG